MLFFLFPLRFSTVPSFSSLAYSFPPFFPFLRVPLPYNRRRTRQHHLAAGQPELPTTTTLIRQVRANPQALMTYFSTLAISRGSLTYLNCIKFASSRSDIIILTVFYLWNATKENVRNRTENGERDARGFVYIASADRFASPRDGRPGNMRTRTKDRG